jgi:hypothetical protein
MRKSGPKTVAHDFGASVTSPARFGENPEPEESSGCDQSLELDRATKFMRRYRLKLVDSLKRF